LSERLGTRNTNRKRGEREKEKEKIGKERE